MKSALGNFTNGRTNNLDILRLFAALFVVFDHTVGDRSSFVLRDNIGQVGVLAFFFMSGFLVTQSYLRNENPKRFAISRCLRIFPALVVVTIITAFVLGPILTKLSLLNYFKSGGVYMYLTTLSLFNWHIFLPGVSQQFVMNGSLWTLQYEVMFYIAVLVLGLAGLFKKGYLLLGATIVSLIFIQLTLRFNDTTDLLNIYQAIRLFAYFGLGATTYLYRKYIPLNKWLLISFVVMLFAGLFFGGLPTALFAFPLAYIIIFVGYKPTINLRDLTELGDFSYGIYIWHFPIMITLVYAFNFHFNFRLFTTDIAFTLPIAVASWYLIEKRMLKLKERLKTVPIPITT